MTNPAYATDSAAQLMLQRTLTTVVGGRWSSSEGLQMAPDHELPGSSSVLLSSAAGHGSSSTDALGRQAGDNARAGSDVQDPLPETQRGPCQWSGRSPVRRSWDLPV